MSDLYRLIYTSRDRTAGDPDARSREIDRLVGACRRNNRRDGVTGALLVGEGTFAQILEGTRTAVEATFERIQCDVRHGDVDVLQCEPVAARMFSNWDMALVGRSERGRLLWKDLSCGAPLDRSRLDGDGLCAAVLATVQAEARSPFPDPEKLRTDLDALRRGGTSGRPAAGAALPAPVRAEPPPTADVGDAVLRAALDEERARTTALRRDLDDARVALARAQAEAEALGRHRDIWADRSNQLRSSLARDREALAVAAGERDAMRDRLAACEADLGRLRVGRDVWADCARALATALSGASELAPAARAETGTPGRERPPLRSVLG